VLFQAGFTSTAKYTDPSAPPPPNLGMNMVYSQTHRRVLAEALAEVMGVDLPAIDDAQVPESALERSFQIAMDDLRDVIVPRINDQQAAVKAKGLARLIKWWRNIDRFGALFEAQELAELASALGRSFANAREGRMALGPAIDAGTIDLPTALSLCYHRELRNSRLLADSMGALATAHLAPLE
jgi:hypothetical protein